MAESSDIGSQFKRLDEAINRDIRRRRRSTWILLALLLLVAATAFYALLKGNEQVKDAISGQVANEIVSENKLTEDIADKIVTEDNFSRTVAMLSAPMIAQTPEFEELFASASLDQRYVTREQLRALVQELIDDSIPPPEPVPEPLQPDSNLETRLIRLENIVNENARRLVSVENSQRAIGDTIVEMQALLARFSEQLQDLESLTGKIGANRVAIDGVLSHLDSLEAHRRARSYLLKTNDSNELSDLSLRVELGGLTEAETLSFMFYDDEDTPVPDSKGGTAAIGESFCLRSAADLYLATFTYAHRRAIVRDFVGLEIVALPASSDECDG